MYTVNGREGTDVRSFLQGARENIMSVLRNNRRTKVKLILKCYMERPSILGEIIQPFAFHSNIEVNLDGTDEDELYITMTERIIEKMATLQQAEGSGWRLHSIIKLELHTKSYNHG